ncbi:MAG: peptidoglycan DD-metalloendopeptidase family protein [Porticoccaceae bacterium]|jgi:septal ring factor EnvC (AmiA/AmiB activator)|tara:strand:+ start:4450 stop:5592 length:1143 start_codon:yes stop_codon:yes gene_type:complete
MKYLWALSILALNLIVPLDYVSAADDQQQARLEKLDRSISKLEKKLRSRDKQKDSLQNELKKVEVEASQLKGNLRKLGKEIRTVVAELSILRHQETDLQARIVQQADVIAEQIAAAHKLGDQEPIKLLLNQENPQQLARMFKYYDYFLQARSEKITSYMNDVESLTEVIARISSQQLALKRSQSDLKSGQEKLRGRVAKRSVTLKQLDASLVSDKKKLGSLQRERSELEEILSAVEEAVADMTLPSNYKPFLSRKGKLSWPLKGRVAHSYGSQRSGELRWEGWLISASAGTAVNAVHNGRIVFSNYLRGFGLLAIVDHGDGYMTLYAHNQELLKDTGDWVQSNELVARAGDTGGLNKPALYFEIRSQGKPADPKVWLEKR